MYEKYPELIFKSETVDRIGKIENVVGMSIEASGGRSGVGDLVMIYDESRSRQVTAEVVGFKEGHLALMPYTCE